MTPFFRRRRLITSRSQVHLVAFQIAYHALFVAVISIALLSPLVKEVESAAPLHERATFARVLLYIHSRVWIMATVMIVAAAVHSILITHRVVGPLVRFRRAIRDVAAGKLAQRLTLRTNDYLDEEAGEFNAMSAALVARIEAVRATLRRVEETTSDVEHALRDGPEERRIARTLRRRLEDLEQELAWFDCSPRAKAPRPDATVEAPESLVPSEEPARRA